ncbi:ladderlectin-like [Genypterus blacodes]|uniref:ladderlectin-like n=1 Tax=Genypterus blacodes TaxID=154954 RepID=UPI003F767F85
MKTLLLISVSLSIILSVTAAPLEGVEAEPKELHEDLQLAEREVQVVLPQEELVEEQSEGEMASSPEVRFYGCPSGWSRYRSGCYQYVSSSRSWSSAAAYCASLGASLPSARDVWDYTFLQDLASRSGGTHAWMGGFYFQGWRWVDQSSFTYQNWNSHLSVSSYPCIYANARAGWSNSNCNSGRPFICVKSTDTC